MDDLMLECESLASKVGVSDDFSIDDIPVAEQDIQRWQALFGCTHDETKQEIQN